MSATYQVASKAATVLPTSQGSSWRFDFDVQNARRLTFCFALTDQSAAGSISYEVFESPDGVTYYQSAKDSSGEDASGVRTRSVSGDDSWASPQWDVATPSAFLSQEVSPPGYSVTLPTRAQPN